MQSLNYAIKTRPMVSVLHYTLVLSLSPPPPPPSLSRLRRKMNSCLGRGKIPMEGRSWPHPPLVMEEGVGHPRPLLLPLPRRHPSLPTLMVRIQENPPPPPPTKRTKHARLLMSYLLALTMAIVAANQCLFGIDGIYM